MFIVRCREIGLSKNMNALLTVSDCRLLLSSSVPRHFVKRPATASKVSMQLPRFYAIGATATLLVISSATIAYSYPLTPFRYEFQAQQHCPLDAVVWVDFRKHVYYLKAQRRYARGFDGSFVCRDEARQSGFRRSLFGLR